jgi:hypothetical protein
VHVETEAGRWHVRRRWAPRHLGADTIWGRFHRRVLDRRRSDLSDIADPGCAVDLGESIAVVLVIIAFIVFMVLVGIPFLIALGELLLLVVLALGGAAGRVLLRRPWTVDAMGPDGSHHRWSVVGWRRSGAARELVADRIITTGAVPTADELPPAGLGPR